jgi:hypothetical protein
MERRLKGESRPVQLSCKMGAMSRGTGERTEGAGDFLQEGTEGTKMRRHF